MIDISLQNIEKMYLDEPVLEGANIEIHTGDKIGLVGSNGSGKTTLFNLISLKSKPDKGTLSRRKNLRVGYLDQIPSFPDGTTVYQVMTEAFPTLFALKKRLQSLEEALSTGKEDTLNQLMETYGKLQSEYEALGGYEFETKIEKISSGLQIDPKFKKRQFATLSGGEKSIVVLAMMLLKQCDLLLLDEPTNHLDISRLEWLEGFISEFKGSIVVISHDRYFLDRSVKQIIELESGTTTLYHGNYSSYMTEKEKNIALGVVQFNNQEKKIKAMREAIVRFREWGRRGGDERFFKKAANMEKRIERMDKVEKPITDPKTMGLTFKDAHRSGKIVLRFSKASKAFGNTVLFEGIDEEIHFKERVAVIGENGSGKSTLIHLIEKNLSPDHGKIEIGANVRIGLLEQEIQFPNPEETVIHCFRSEVPVDEGKARNFLAKYLFTRNDVFKSLKDLSGGERVRLKLCLLTHQDYNFLILDEPTNHLDIPSRKVFEDAIQNFSGTILFISHDRFFINAISNRILAIENSQLVSYLGNYDEYKHTKDKKRKEETTQKKVKKGHSKKEALTHKEKKHLSKNQHQQLEKEKIKLENRLSKIESEIDKIDKNSEHFPDDYEKQLELFEEKKSLENEADKILNRLIEID